MEPCELLPDLLPEEPSVSADVPDEPLTEVDPPLDTAREPSAPSTEDYDALRRQVEELTSRLAAKEEELLRAKEEWDAFETLFPGTSSDQIPPSVWQDVQKGIPLSAAYALYERKSRMDALLAEQINDRNAKHSAGRVGTDTEQEFFTRDEVRAMSPAQVHHHYQKIRRSMKSWNE